MTSTISLRGLELGEGVPKIAVPLTGQNRDSLCQQARKAASIADLVEWRADYFAFTGADDIMPLLTLLRKVIGNLPLLFTFRSTREGGKRDLPDADYEKLYRAVIQNKSADAVDIEQGRGEDICKRLVGLAHENGQFIVLSSHDFSATPPMEEMLGRLLAMKALGADLPKIAVMPQSEADVLALLAACEAYAHGQGAGPLIAVSMGRLGCISRLAAGFFGSAITFGTAGGASAPGQMDAATLRGILQEIY